MIVGKHLDPVLGVDIHIIMIPATPPIPTPIPHPFIGMVMDKMDYLPVIGAKVMVNGMYRAVAGTEVANTPHIPIGGPFAPPPPGNEGEIFMGSSTVLAGGEPLSSLGMPVLSCQSIGMPSPPRSGKPKKTTSLQLPTSVLMAVPGGGIVMVGGAPTINMMAMAMKFGMGALKKGFGKFKKIQKNSDVWKKLSQKLNKKADDLFDKLGLSKLGKARDRVRRAICSVTGHPVDISTGKVFTDFIDFELPGPIPLKWERVWFSTSDYKGPLGHGWHHNYDMAMAFSDDKETIGLRLNDGRIAAFPTLNEGDEYFNVKEKILLYRDGTGYAIRDENQLIHRFSEKAKGILKNQPLVSIENKAGFKIEFSYNSFGYLSKIIDSAGRVLMVNNDQNGRIRSIDAPDPRGEGAFSIISYDYDDLGDLIKATDPLSKSTLFEYEDHLLKKETDKNGLSFYFEYAGKGIGAYCIRTWGDDGIYDHKLKYNIKEKYTEVTNSLGHVTVHHWNDLGVVWKEMDPMGNALLTEWSDDAQILGEIDKLGRLTQYSYDEHGNMTMVAEPDGATTVFSYNKADQLISVTDPIGSTWSWAYDEFDQVIRKSDPSGAGISFLYDDNNILQGLSTPEGTSFLDYDDEHNLVSLTSPTDTKSKWEYDKLGRCTQASDSNKNVQYREFDLAGNLKKVTEPDGNKRVLKHDLEGNVISVKDKHHNVLFEYGGMNKLKKRIEAGTEIDFRYNTEEDLIGLSNEKGENYFFQRNANSEIISEVGFDGISRSYLRDEEGQVKQVTGPNGKVTSYTYNEGGRVYKVEQADGTFEIFHYDAAGNLIEALNQHSTVSFTRDKMGRVVEEESNGFWVKSEYDAFGRKSFTSALGADVAIERNKQGWVTGVNAKEDEKEVWNSTIKHDAFGLELERSLPGNVTASFERDNLGRPIAHVVRQNNKRKSAKRYAWDANDRLTSIIDEVKNGKASFDHDSFGNLIKASYGNGEELFRTADEVGNLFKTKNKSDRKYGKGSRLLECDQWKYSYDTEGNLIEKRSKKGKGNWEYRWQTNGMLQEVTRPDGGIVAFKYDALGRRIEKSFRGTSTHWIWDGNVPLHEWSQNSKEGIIEIGEYGEIKAKVPERNTTWLFEEGTFVPMARLEKGKSYSIISNYLGTPAEMYDDAGERIWSCDLDIYGKVRELEGDSKACPFRYQGQYEDVETELYYNRFRYYSPDQGGYMSQDPIRLNGGMQTFYSYVFDPHKFLDILGLGLVETTLEVGGETFTAQSKKATFDGAFGDIVNAIKNDLDSKGLLREFHGNCAELRAIRKALVAGHSLDDLAGATMRTVFRKSGEIKKACDCCKEVLSQLGIEELCD